MPIALTRQKDYATITEVISQNSWLAKVLADIMELVIVSQC
jgi:hypothetical protein